MLQVRETILSSREENQFQSLLISRADEGYIFYFITDKGHFEVKMSRKDYLTIKHMVEDSDLPAFYQSMKE